MVPGNKAATGSTAEERNSAILLHERLQFVAACAGTNLGLSRMADATRGLSYHLVNQAQWHINEDNVASGRAVIVDAHHRHPMAAIWGDGTNSSSDGHYFRAGGRAGPGGDVNAK